MLLSEWSWLNRSFVEHPPVDLLVASYLGYKAPARDSSDAREAARGNSQALQSVVHPRIGTLGEVLTHKGKGSKTLDQMPTWIQGQETMDIIARMKAEMGATNGG